MGVGGGRVVYGGRHNEVEVMEGSRASTRTATDSACNRQTEGKRWRTRGMKKGADRGGVGCGWVGVGECCPVPDKHNHEGCNYH